MSTIEQDNKDKAEAMFAEFAEREQAELGNAEPVNQDQVDVTIAKATKVTKKSVKTPKPKRQVDPKSFHVLRSHMGLLNSFSIVMTNREMLDYGDYEFSLYEKDGSRVLDRSSGDAFDNKMLNAMHLRERFQRKIDSTRVSKIAQYVLAEPVAKRDGSKEMIQPHSFFPAGIYCPRDRETYDALCALATDTVAASEMNVELKAAVLLALDGQHRRAGVERLVENLERDISVQQNTLTNAQESMAKLGTNPERQANIERLQASIARDQANLARVLNESCAYVIVNIDPDDRITRQQIFNDINKNMRKVSKAVSNMFDHSDYVSLVAKWLCGEETELGDPFHDSDLSKIIDVDHLTAPRSKGSAAVTLTNVISFLRPKKEQDSAIITALSEGRMSLDQVGELFLTICCRLPQYDNLVAGGAFGSLIFGKYVVWNSAFWQAIGQLVSKLVDEQLERHIKKTGEYSGDIQQLIDNIDTWLVDMSGDEETGSVDQWLINDKAWRSIVLKNKSGVYSVVNKRNTIESFAETLEKKYRSSLPQVSPRAMASETSGSDASDDDVSETDTEESNVETENVTE